MNGAESLVRTAIAAGVEVCFANPGTTEISIVTALDAAPGIRAVLGLFEGVCTGAADGYARIAGKPAMTLLHLGPGFANGIANLHNARRGRSPVVNVIGDHMSWHRGARAPLESDIVSLARPVSDWLRTNRGADSLAADTAQAIAAASAYPGHVATLIVPADHQAAQAAGPAAPLPATAPPDVGDRALSGAARALRGRKPAALLLGAGGLTERGLRAAARIAAASGCALFCETFPARLERGGGLPAVEKIPYFPEQALERLAGFGSLVLAGAPDPVAFFGYPGLPSRVRPEQTHRVLLARPHENAACALEVLAENLGTRPEATAMANLERPERPAGPLTIRTLGQALAAVQPEGAIVIDEANTCGPAYFPLAAAAPSFTYLSITGGAIGFGPPAATGAALARPGARVLALQADGSALYTIQALWTQARERLDVTTIVCNNRSYRILRVELARAGIREPGPSAVELTDLSEPPIDWIALARGLGVPASRVTTAEELTGEIDRSIGQPGPYLIDAVVES